MRNFSLKTRGNSHQSSRRTVALRFLALYAGILVTLWFFGPRLGNVVAILTKPLYAARTYFAESTAALPSYLRSRTELLDEIEKLKQELARGSGNAASIALFTQENDALRALLSATSSPRIAAGVIARPPAIPYDVLLIDRGSAHGVREGAPVYLFDDIVIGSVATTFSTSALVTLFSSPQVVTTVYVFGPDVFSFAYGEGGGVVRVSIPPSLPLHVGDVVVLPTLETGMLGTIHSVETSPTEPEQSGFLTFELPLHSIRFVSIGQEVVEPVSFEEARRHVEAASSSRFVLEVPPEFLSDPIATSSTPVMGTTSASGVPTN